MTALAVRTNQTTARPLTVWLAAGHGLYLHVAAVSGTVLWAGGRADLDTYRHDPALDTADAHGCSALPDQYGPTVDPLVIGGGLLPRNRLVAYAQRLSAGDIEGAHNLINPPDRGHHA